MSEALYRKYRSKKLSEIIGQHHVTDLLERALERDKVSHAYLLTGPRGVGKTSIARILAHEINNIPYTDESTNLDIIEIDAASNNGVEDVRELREKVQLAPAAAPKKVYIIDEVHMLSKPAFNALLKTLEEPPSHAVFILATTDADKIPQTILSRTQRFTFRLVSRPEVAAHLRTIADSESILIDDEALNEIAEQGGGSFRDSISLLDQLQMVTDTDTQITKHDVESMLGLATKDALDKLITATKKHDLAQIHTGLAAIATHGTPAPQLVEQLILELQERSLQEPTYLNLIDSLLEVSRSSRPDSKLFVVLGNFAKKTKVASLTAEAPAELLELQAAASRDIPVVTPPVAKKPLQSQSTEKPKATPAKTTKAIRKTSPQTVPKLHESVSQNFDWQAIVAIARNESVALFSVLAKCDVLLQDQTLTIFARNTFYKTKLDDVRHRTSLQTILQAAGFPDLTIETVAATKPPKNSQAAKIAAMMGGGEEISIE